MRYEHIIATVIIALLAGTISSYLVLMGQMPSGKDRPKTTIERVVADGKIRCGYVVGPPYFTKDENTGAFSGLWYELTEQIGTVSGVQVVWTAPTTEETAAADLQAGKFDAVCTGILASSAGAKAMAYSAPVYYSHTRGRADDAPNLMLGNVYAVRQEDGAVRDLLSAGVQEIQSSGFAETALAKYAGQIGEFYRAAPLFAR